MTRGLCSEGIKLDQCGCDYLNLLYQWERLILSEL